jgi:hypothetical protein
MSDLGHRPPADHSVKIPHLVFGLLFLGAAGIWALVVTDVITEDRLPVLAPAVLIVAGVIGLAVSLASSRNRRQRTAAPVPEPLVHERDEVDRDHGSDDLTLDDLTRDDETQQHDADLDHTREIR